MLNCKNTNTKYIYHHEGYNICYKKTKYDTDKKIVCVHANTLIRKQI